MEKEFQHNVLQWYKKFGRKHLPWQQDVTPYKVWISEIMLQQTQVATVIPYFERFMKRFPTITSLANAASDEVLHHWSGLGYYSRARNLHTSAKMIVENYAGKLPNSLDQLLTLPGIGRSTAGAILALGFKQHATILDGNVKRVLSRYHCIEGWPGHTKTLHQLWEIAAASTPQKNVAEYTQAMMDLGALICTRSSPQCVNCPLVSSCKAYALEKQLFYPQKKEKKSLPRRETIFLILEHEGKFLLEKRAPVGIWGGLWCFPQCSVDDNIKAWIAKNYSVKFIGSKPLPEFLHTFSHFQLLIKPHLIQVKSNPNRVMETSEQIWYNLNHPQIIGLAAPMQKLLQQLQRTT